MIIQNSYLNSSASRRYQSTKNSYVENQTWDNATGTSFTEVCSSIVEKREYSASNNGALCDAPVQENDTSEHKFSEDLLLENANASDSSVVTNELDDLMERFKTYSPRHIPTVREKLEMVHDIQQKTLSYLLRILFGDKAEYVRGANHIDRTKSAAEKDANNTTTLEAELLGQTLGTGGHHEYFYYYAETETTCFQTTGTAITADGRKLSFNISVEMSRSFVEIASESINFGQPRFCDPLVINLNTNVASVSDQKFFFDLDVDGQKEEISILDATSGYLALDNNEDGIINDGSELFGTKSGNGFKDLSLHDEDGNGWIDELDSIFDKLKIWSMDADGNSTLIDLITAGVGAIFLGYEDTQFALNNAENETNAMIQKTGLFLFEDGDSGTVQQLDLAV